MAFIERSRIGNDGSRIRILFDFSIARSGQDQPAVPSDFQWEVCEAMSDGVSVSSEWGVTDEELRLGAVAEDIETEVTTTVRAGYDSDRSISLMPDPEPAQFRWEAAESHAEHLGL